MLHTTSALALSALAMVAPSSHFSAASAISNLPHPGGSPQRVYVDLSLLKEADLDTPGKERACDHGGSASPSMDDKEARCRQPLADFFDWPKPSLTSSTFSSSPPAREVRCPGSNKQQHLCLPEFARSCMIMRSGFGRSSPPLRCPTQTRPYHLSPGPTFAPSRFGFGTSFSARDEPWRSNHHATRIRVHVYSWLAHLC